MPDLRGRSLIEARYGKLGSGNQSLTLKGVACDLATLLTRMDLLVEDSRPIDVVVVAENTYCIRYYDGQDQRIVAHEFDADFHFLGEIRAHVAEWIGEENFYKLFHGTPSPPTELR